MDEGERERERARTRARGRKKAKEQVGEKGLRRVRASSDRRSPLRHTKIVVVRMEERVKGGGRHGLY